MKASIVLAVVSAVILCGIGIWLAIGNPFFGFQFFSSQPLSVLPAGDAQPGADPTQVPAPAKPAKALVKAAKKTPALEAQNAPEPVVVETAPEIAVAQQVAQVAPKQFPSAKGVVIGVEREEIAEKFGEPSLATTSMSENGRVVETLVYARKSGRDVTVIRIEDGKVLSVQSR